MLSQAGILFCMKFMALIFWLVVGGRMDEELHHLVLKTLTYSLIGEEGKNTVY